MSLITEHQHALQVFDSATHPTINGKWTASRNGLTFRALAEITKPFAHYRALAHGLPQIGDYSHFKYREKCIEFGFEAIAALTTTVPGQISSELTLIAELGYRGVKVHPRLLGANQNLQYLTEVFRACSELGMTCLLCTYEPDSPGNLPESDPYYEICKALNSSPETKLILMHGGGSRIVQFAGLARHSQNLLLDLSFTFLDKLTRPSEDIIQQLLNELDQRICIGSDSPEIEVPEFIVKLRSLLQPLTATKAQNIAYQNLVRFFPANQSTNI